MGALTDLFGGLLKPLLVALLLLIALGIFSNRPDSGGQAAVGFACKQWTSDPEWNRIICIYHPARVWHMPVTDLLPFLAGRQG